jgi:hypothetical protein
MTLTRATLGKRLKRKTTDIVIDGDTVRMQKPTPLQYSEYQAAIVNEKGDPGITRFAASLALLTVRMWIDADGNRLYSDKEAVELASTMDIDFYEEVAEACRKYAKPEVSKALGESEPTTASDSPVEYALNSE